MIENPLHVQCDLCGKEFFSQNKLLSLQRHKTVMHNKENSKHFVCDICDKTFPLLIYLKHHVKFTHENSGKCSKCGEQVDDLNLHWNTVHHGRKRKFIGNCEICGKDFASKNGLKDHYNTFHNGLRPYFCEICSKHFSQKVALEAHFRRQHQESSDQFTCDICKKTFQHEEYLNSHIKYLHEKKYSRNSKCGKCNKVVSNLSNHVRAVHNGKKFICSFCKSDPKSFISKMGLKAHINSFHKGLRPYSCEVCGDTFTQKAVLKTHFKRIHQKSSSIFTCDICKKTFDHKDYLTFHIKRRHEKKYLYPKNKTVIEGNPCGNDSWQDVKSCYACDICNKIFEEIQHLKSHYQTVHNRNEKGGENLICVFL